jgi:hypothetical protein
MVAGFVRNGLLWLVENLLRFDPFRDCREPDLLKLKAIAELAELCMDSVRASYNAVPEMDRIVDFIAETAGGRQFQEVSQSVPEVFHFLLVVDAALRTCSRPNPHLHDGLRWQLDAGYLTAIERKPSEELDVRFHLDRAGFHHSLPSYEALYERTLLAQDFPVSYLSNDDVYDITHTIFFTMDDRIGQLRIPAAHLPRITWMIGVLLAIHARYGNLDLLAELLLSCRYLRSQPRHVFAESWKALLASQRSDGSIPGPDFNPENAASLVGDERATYSFETNYHTTIVAIQTGILSGEW